MSPDEARKCILRGPAILRFDHGKVVLRVKLLKSLGYIEAHTMVLAEPHVLNYKEETVREHAAWWKQTGLDHVKLLTTQPTLLGAPKTIELQAKLIFLSRVVGMSKDDLNKAAALFTYSLDNRLRARYFYALQKHRLARFTVMSTMTKETDAVFLAMMQGGTVKDCASKAEVACYQKLVSSAGFVAWRKRQEARILRRP